MPKIALDHLGQVLPAHVAGDCCTPGCLCPLPVHPALAGEVVHRSVPAKGRRRHHHHHRAWVGGCPFGASSGVAGINESTKPRW